MSNSADLTTLGWILDKFDFNSGELIDGFYEHDTLDKHVADLFRLGKLYSINRLMEMGIQVTPSAWYELDKRKQSEKRNADYIEFARPWSQSGSRLATGWRKISYLHNGKESYYLGGNFSVVRLFFDGNDLESHPNAEPKKFKPYFAIKDELDLTEHVIWTIFPSHELHQAAMESAKDAGILEILNNRTIVLNPSDYLQYQNGYTISHAWKIGNDSIASMLTPEDRRQAALVCLTRRMLHPVRYAKITYFNDGRLLEW